MRVFSVHFLLLKTLESEYYSLKCVVAVYQVQQSFTITFNIRYKSHNLLVSFAEQSDHQKRDFVGQLDKT